MKKKSLFQRLLFSFLVLMLLPMVLMMLFFGLTISPTMERQAQANVDFYIDQTVGFAEDSVANAKNILYQSMLDSQIRRFMKAKGTYNLSEARNHLSNIISRTELFMDSQHKATIRSVSIVRNDQQIVAYAARGVNAAYERRILEVYGYLKDVFSPKTLYRSNDPEDDRLYFVLDYKDVDSMQKEGKAIVELDPGKMVHTQLLTDTYTGAVINLRNENGDILYTSDPALSEEMDGDADKGFYHVLRHGNDTNLQADVYVPKNVVYGGIDRVNRLFLLVVILIALFIAAVGIWEYRSFKKAIRVMTDTLGEMAGSGYHLRMPESKYTELSSVSDTFNAMADNLEQSFADVYQKGIMLEKSEYRLLSAQINPHFIFNVLETIHMRCVTAHQGEISDMVTNLAKLLRGNIGVSKSAFITLEEELNYIRYYMELQRGRFGDKLRYSLAFEDKELLTYLVPRLTIQPLVENAVVHGLEPISGMGEVRVRIWEEDDMICVRIEDNGVGFDAEHLDYRETEENNRTNHVAIPNIVRRLQLLYNDRASLHFDSVKGNGTKVMLTIPKWTGDNHV